MSYLQLIRPLNLLLVILTQWLIKLILIPLLDVSVALSNFQFAALTIATVLIAAGGNIINDVYDVAIDKINKPKKLIITKHIKEGNAMTLYMVLTVLGVAAGFYVANSVEKPSLAAVFVIIAGLLYLYASSIKNMLLLGNLLISVLVAMSIIVIILFDIYPAITTDKMESQIKATSIILQYAGFAFYFNLMREIIKDIEDIDGDKNGGRNTLAIVLGRKRTRNLVIIMAFIGVAFVLWYMYQYLYASQAMVLYFLFATVAPLFFFIIKAWDVKTKKQFGFLSNLLKVILLLGVCSILFLSTIL